MSLLLLLPLLACTGKDPVDTAADDTDVVDTSTDTSDTSDTGDTGLHEIPMLEAGFEAALTETSGCADIYVYAHDEDATMMLQVEAFDLGIANAACLGGPQSLVIDLPAEGVSASLLYGERVTGYACTDIIADQPVVLRTWVATAGTITFNVTAAGSAICDSVPYAQADAVLENLVLTPEDGGEGEVTLPSLAIDAFVGWLPG